MGIPCKHVSFDLWLTLIKSNPLYKPKRNQLFKDFFEIDLPTDEVASKVRYYDNACNLINEKTGGNIDTLQIFGLILTSLNVTSYTQQKLDSFYAETEDLFFKYPPYFINPNTAAVLSHLTNNGISINLLSNTGFIKGKTLRKFIENSSLHTYFNFQVYSDECLFSKPNNQIFEQAYQQIKLINPLAKSEVLHVGDNLHADYEGARSYGFNSVLIKNTEIE